MGKAINAIHAGITYQNLFFWLCASEMLHKESNIKEVSYEDNRIKSIDDVVVEYDKPLVGDYDLNEINMDFYQVKYHVKNSESIELLDLIDPSFINATTYSFLQRVQEAIKNGYANARFQLVTTWNIKQGDLLEKLLDNRDNKLNTDLLFDGKQRSALAKARIAIMKHLGLQEDAELVQILRSIRIQHSKPGISIFIKEQLNNSLKLAGLTPINDRVHTNPYNDLIISCAAKGVNRFSKPDLIKLCKREGVYYGQPLIVNDEISVGIRSFLPFTESLEDETDHLLCISNLFSSRLLKEDKSWNEDVASTVKDFLQQTLLPGNAYYVQFNTHLSITFAAGMWLNPKSGTKVFPVQRGDGLVAWIPDVHSADYTEYTSFKEYSELEALTDLERARDTIVSISITRDIRSHVEWYVEQNKFDVQASYHFSMEAGGAKAVRDGTHAWFLAEQVIRALDKRNPNQRKGRVHLFIAAPGGFVFFLGQLAGNIPNIVCYEHDFTGDGSYSPSFTLPI